MSRPMRIGLAMGAAGASAALAIATTAFPHWIELVFRIDPDGGSGSTEWLFVVALFALAVAFSLIAHAERRPVAGGPR
jgi:hypothetical protein